MRRAATHLALVAASLAVTLVALEAGARRFADPTGGFADILAQAPQARSMSVHVASDDPVLVYVTRPGYETSGVRISEAHGILRATDVTVEKPPGVFRIAVLGDSIAAAHPIRVGGEPSFSEVLEQTLSPRGPLEVLNFGTDGYGTVQEARLYETHVNRFTPDLVLVAYCLNDPANSYTPTVWFLDGKEPSSYLFDLIRRRLGGTPSELHPGHPRYTHGAVDWERLYRPEGAAWTQVEAALARASQLGDAKNVPVVLVLFPLLAEAVEPSASRIYAQIEGAAERGRLGFIDLGSAFAGRTAAELRLLPADPIHPNARGHRVAGEAIAEALTSRRLVP
jgi:lysophospholipase L1-like esterase